MFYPEIETGEQSRTKGKETDGIDSRHTCVYGTDDRERAAKESQAALAVQFWNGTQLQLIFVSAAMSIRSLDNEHLISDMTSYFSSNPFGTISCEIPVMDVFTDG